VEEILSKNLERRGNDIFIQEHLRWCNYSSKMQLW
jgi:hypothetical protein